MFVPRSTVCRFPSVPVHYQLYRRRTQKTGLHADPGSLDGSCYPRNFFSVYRCATSGGTLLDGVGGYRSWIRVELVAVTRGAR